MVPLKTPDSRALHSTSPLTVNKPHSPCGPTPPCCSVCHCSLKLRESKAKGGGLVVEGVSGNAAKSGIKAGDTIIYASSFFGDELWPADKLSFTQTAIQRAPSPVAFVYVSGVWDSHRMLRTSQGHNTARKWSNEGCGSGCCWWDALWHAFVQE